MNIQRTKKAEAIKGFIFALTLLSASVFFSVYSLIGRTYAGSESSPTYVIYMVSLLILEAALFLWEGRFTRKEFLWLLVPLAFTALAWIFSLVHGGTLNVTIIRNVILWQYTGILLAINVNRAKVDDYIVKFLVILMLVVTLGSMSNILIPFFRGISVFSTGFSLVGSSFQSQSYAITVAIGINLFLFYAKAKKTIYKIISYGLLGIQFLCAILYAGRGGMLLALIYLIAYFLYMNRGKKITTRKMIQLLLYAALLLLLYFLISRMITSSNILQGRFRRVFSYIGSGKLDLSQSSNRDVLYRVALKYILDSPVIGYGTLGYIYLDGLNRYPHNILLEMMIEGGVIYLGIWIYIVIRGIRRIRHLKELNIYKVYLVIGLFILTKLSFSSTYCYEMQFWFCVVFSNLCKREVTSSDRSAELS